MANNGIKITAPVSITDIKTVLRVSANGIISLSRADAINKWSLAKPIPYPSPKIDRTLLDRWYDGQKAGYNLTCGLTYNPDVTYPVPTGIGYNSSLGGFILTSTKGGFFYQLASGTDGSWQYIKPSGGESSPSRFGDFRDYVHNAINPLPYVKSGVYKFNPTTGVAGIQITKPTQVDGGVTLAHLKSYRTTTFDNLYLGILFYNDSLTDCFWVTDQNAVYKNMNTQIAISNSGGSYPVLITNKRGKYHTKTFFSSVKITMGQTDFTAVSNSIYVVAANNDVNDVVLLSSSLAELYIVNDNTKYLDTNKTQIKFDAYIGNWTLSSVSAAVYFIDKTDLLDDVTSLGTVTIASQTEQSFSATVSRMIGVTRGKFRIVVGGTTYESEEFNIA